MDALLVLREPNVLRERLTPLASVIVPSGYTAAVSIRLRRTSRAGYNFACSIGMRM